MNLFRSAPAFFIPAKKWLGWFLIALPLFLCQSCTYLAALRHTYTANAVPEQNFHFQDGGQAIYFTFDKRLDTRPPTAAPSAVETYLFVISGSDCTSMKYLLPQYFRGLEGESGPIRIFILQKRFIEARTWGRVLGCSEDFVKADHPQRWIADQAEFINAQLASAQNRAASPKRVVVLGISEGGDIVPVLARHIAGVTHAAILANGGMDPLDAYRLQAGKHGFNIAPNTLQNMGPALPGGPDAAAHRIAGRTWRYWFELGQLKHTEGLLALTMPLLVAMGEADQAVPIESAQYLGDQFTQHGKSNLTLLSYPHADHALQSNTHSYLPDFWHAFDLWIDK